MQYADGEIVPVFLPMASATRKKERKDCLPVLDQLMVRAGILIVSALGAIACFQQ